jgi:putative ABC transport system substrate-binding protein
MLRIKSLAILLIGLGTLGSPFQSFASAPDKHVAITQIVEHPALDAVRKGVKDVLSESGWDAEKNLKWEYQSAQGNPTTAAQIAKKFAGSNPDVIVAIATPSAQAMVASARNSNIIFSAVTDPVDAKLVKAWDQPSPKVTGVSDLTPIDKHMALVKEIVPAAKTIGIIYNPGEANAVSLVKLVNEHAPQLGMTVIEAASPKSADVQTAMRSLVGKVDAVYLPTDNTVISALEGVIKVAEQAKIPVIAGDTDSVKRGAIAALGFDYYQVGRQTGGMVVDVLNGKTPGELPVQGIENTELFVNLGAAEKMGITLDEVLIKRAQEVVE